MPQIASESAYLADQAADARRALFHTVRDMKETVRGMVDVSGCATRHPWIMTGSAVAVGFATGAMLTSAPRENLEASPSRAGAAKSFLFSTFGLALTAILRSMVQGTVSAIIAGGDEPANEPKSPQDSSEADAPRDESD